MAPTPSPELIGKTLMGFVMIALVSIILIAAVGYYSYKYSGNFYKSLRIGQIKIFDASEKYKQIILYTVAFFIAITISFKIKLGS